MNKNDYLRELQNQKIDDSKVKKIEKLYKCTIPDDVKRIISNCDETIFFDDDDCRVLSFDEILDAEEDLEVEFRKEKMIPLFDCLDNDFIVYKTDSQTWMLYNIVDEMDFDEVDSLEELLED